MNNKSQLKRRILTGLESLKLVRQAELQFNGKTDKYYTIEDFIEAYEKILAVI